MLQGNLVARRRHDTPPQIFLPYLSRFQSSELDQFHTVNEVGYTPPFAVQFNHTGTHVAMVDEEGVMDIVDARESNAHPHNDFHSRKMWTAHDNAIFDVCWSNDDASILTAGGDQTVKLWDIETRSLKHLFASHTCSVKSINANPEDPHVYATAARDGHIMIWDTRCNGSVSQLSGAARIRIHRPADSIKFGHVAQMDSLSKLRRKSLNSKSMKLTNQSVSCVKYILDRPNVLISAGSADGTIKLWDMRYHGYHSSRKQHQAAQKAPTYLASSEQLDQWKRPHGFTSLALDPTGGNIFVTCTDNSIYQFNTTNISYPIARYTARTLHISSFYIRCSVSPDGRYVASGSGDSNVHVWQVGATTLTKSDYDSNRRRYGQHEYLRHKSSTMRDSGSSSGGISRQMKPSIMLKVHTQEVTGIDWNKSFPDQLASCSDDGTVRLWNFKRHTAAEDVQRIEDEEAGGGEFAHLRSSTEVSQPVAVFVDVFQQQQQQQRDAYSPSSLSTFVINESSSNNNNNSPGGGGSSPAAATSIGGSASRKRSVNMTQQRIVLTLGGQLLLASSPAYNSASSSSSSSVAAAAAAAALLPGVSSSSLSSSVSASASTAAGGPSNSSSLLSSPAADNLNNIYTPSRLIIDEATPRGGSGRSNVCVGTGGVMDDDDVNRNNDEESEDVLSLSVATTPCSKRIRMATAATITAEVRMENQDILQQVGETRGGEDQSSRSTLVHLGIDDIIPIMSPPPVLTSIEGNGGEGDKSLMAVEESEVEMGVDVELAQGTDQTNNNNNNNIFINSNNVTTSSSSQYHQHRQRSIIISLAEKNKENNPAIASKSSSSPGSGSNNNNNGVNAATSITDDQENENRYFPIFKPRKPRLSG